MNSRSWYEYDGVHLLSIYYRSNKSVCMPDAAQRALLHFTLDFLQHLVDYAAYGMQQFLVKDQSFSCPFFAGTGIAMHIPIKCITFNMHSSCISCAWHIVLHKSKHNYGIN